jgi:hypothetical protein
MIFHLEVGKHVTAEQVDVFQAQLVRASAKSAIAVAIRYGLNHWEGLERFIEDDRIEIDTNVVERSMRPIREKVLGPEHPEAPHSAKHPGVHRLSLSTCPAASSTIDGREGAL